VRTQLPNSLIVQPWAGSQLASAPQVVVHVSLWSSNWHSGLRVHAAGDVATTAEHLVKHVRRLSSHWQRPAASPLHESLDGY